MKNEIHKDHLEQFKYRLLLSIQNSKRDLDFIETSLWKKANRPALWWNNLMLRIKLHRFKMTICSKEVVVKHSIEYLFQRCELMATIEKKTMLLERLDYAIRNKIGVVLEDSDYTLLKK